MKSTGTKVKEADKTQKVGNPSGVHLTKIRVESYRGIRNLDVPRLAQINLFAGENGCGKSSLLEAVMWLTIHRGIEHTHDDVHIESVARDEPELAFYSGSPDKLGDSMKSLADYYVKGLRTQYFGKYRPHFSRKHDELFHNTEHGISPPKNGIDRKFDAAVIHAGRVAEPDLHDIKYELVSHRDSGIRHDCLMAVMSDGASFPIAGLGAGARHMMAIMSKLANAPSPEEAKPVFLVDEIDEGLHRKIHARFWRLLISEAVARQVQVLATTHSLDCVNGFAAAGVEYPSWTTRYFRLEKGEDRENPGDAKTYAVDYSAEVLASAIANKFDPR